MGLFKTSVIYNPGQVQAAIEEINNIRNSLNEAKGSLYSGLSMIQGATGFDLVEAEGVSIDTGIADSLTSECINSIDTIVNSINEKTMEIQAYNDAEGLNKYWIFANIKFKDIRTDLDKKINELLTTGAAATGSFESEADKILKTSKKKSGVLDFFKSLASDTGAVICKGASKALDILKSAGSSVKGWFKNLFTSDNQTSTSKDKKSEEILKSDNKEKSKTKVETKQSISQNSSDPTIKSINSKLSNTHTENKSIKLDELEPNTRVTKAIDEYADEIKNADYATISKNLFTTTKTENINGSPVQVTHVVINDPSQIKAAPANGGYGNGLEKPSDAAKRLNSAILVNGSHFDLSGDGTQDLRGANYIAISNGQIKTDGNSGGQEMLLDKSGRIFNSYGRSAQDLVNSGVDYSFSCHSTQVIENGDTSPSQREGRAYKRTVVGMKEPCEYYITTDQTGGNILSNTANYLQSKGCTNAYSLDQGGSVALARNDKLINQVNSNEGERAVADFLYFTE